MNDKELEKAQAKLDATIANYKSYSNRDLLSKFSALSYFYEDAARKMTMSKEQRDEFWLVYQLVTERMQR